MAARIGRLLAGLIRTPELPLAPGERLRETPRGGRGRMGAVAEDAAAGFLRDKGYRILCRNRVNSVGELDIVAQDGDGIVFVEVRARKSGASVTAKDTLTQRKRRTLARAAELFSRQHGFANAAARIDLVAVEFGDDGEVGPIDHIESAVGAEGR